MTSIPSKLMKIAISSRYILPKMEGIGRYTKEIIIHLVRTHPDDHFYILLDRNYIPEWLKQLDVEIIVVRPQARHPLLWYAWYEWRLPACLKRIQPDVLFCPEGYLSKNTKVPTVMTVHDLAFKHFPKGTYPSHIRYLRKKTSEFIDRADHIMCVSSYTEKDLHEHYPNAKGKTSAVGHGVGPEFTPMSNTEKEKIRQSLTGGIPFILYLGSMHPRKNITRLIEAFEMYMAEGQARKYLVLAGRLAWKSESIRKKIEGSSFGDYIIYGSDLGIEIPQLVGSAEVLCYVSLLEGFGLPTLEAMASGTPVITSRDSAMSEVCEEAAIYVNPRDAHDIKNSLVYLVNHEDVRQQLVTKGIERAASFRWERTADHVYRVLQGVRNR